MKKKDVTINNLFLALGVLLLLYYLGMGISVRFGQSMLWVWPVAAAVCLGRFFLWRAAWKKGKNSPLPRWLSVVIGIGVTLALAVFLFVEGLILSASLRRPPEGLDAIVILGSRVNEDGPSGSLRERIDTAAEYLRQSPDTVAIASGGQGEDEPMSEARCIYDHLVAAGIDPARIRLEEQSTSTLENLTFSFAMLGDSAREVGILTNDFHVYRAMLLGRTIGGYALHGIPARSNPFGYIHYAMREFCALTVSVLRGYFA